MTASHSSSVMLTSTRSRRMPALLTSMSSRPNVSTAVLIRRWPPSQSATLSRVGDRLAAHRRDLVDDLFGRGAVASGAVGRAAEVVDDDLGALRGEQQRVLATDAAPGAGDDGYPTFERTHDAAPRVLSSAERRNAKTRRSGYRRVKSVTPVPFGMRLVGRWIGEQHRVARVAGDADDREARGLQRRGRVGDGLAAHVRNRDRLRALREDDLDLGPARHLGARRGIRADDLARRDGVAELVDVTALDRDELHARERLRRLVERHGGVEIGDGARCRAVGHHDVDRRALR